MLIFLNGLAKRFQRFKSAVLGLLFASVAGFLIIILVLGERYDVYAMLLAVLCLWLTGLLAILAYFPVSIPIVDSEDDLLARFKQRLRYALVWLVGLTVIVVGAAVAVMTVRLLSIVIK